MRIPARLREGDTVAITATSGVVNPEKLAAGIAILENMGLRARIYPSCHAAHGYLAGTDSLRLRDLHAAFADKKIRAIFAARGGYGAARLLPHLDYAMIRRNPKIFAGYSDVTALHIALNQFCNLVTFHAPMPAADLPNADDVTLESFVKALGGQKNCHCKGGRAGILTGGNLTIIAASIGTPFEIDTRNRFLFIEETGEHPYRVDRLLLQLKHAGKLKNAAGFALGDFSPETYGTIKLAISELLIPEGKPIITGIPAGHCMPNITLPLGQRIKLCFERE